MGILEMKQISKSFLGVYANENINLSIEKGEIHALLGENGAGKTTLMNILFGIYKPDSGEIFWKGEKVDFSSPKQAIESGIGMVHQHFSLVKRLSVMDNIILGLKNEGMMLDRKSAKARIEALAQKYGLAVDPKAIVANLSVGQQQRVEILKALYRNVDLLILDEPTGVLTPKETAQFFDVLRKLKEEGYAIIIITHRMSEIMSISDKVSILRDGKKIIDLNTQETNPTELSHYMIGRTLNEHFDVRSHTQKEEALVLSNVSIKKHHKAARLDHISLTLNQGEILGIAGVDGNGQTDLAEVIAGIQKPTEGQVSFYGEDITKFNVKKKFAKGISYISDDRHSDGLVLPMSVEENLILRDYGKRPFSIRGFLQSKQIQQNAIEQIEKYRIKTSGNTKEKTPVRLMSGGNQQKIIISREASKDAKLIIANQPTRGLDMGASEFVRQVLVEQRNEGKSVILISADLEEIMALSDRVAIMFGGKVMAVLARDEVTLEKIGLLMGGIVGQED